MLREKLVRTKTNFIKDYWPQLTTIVMALLLLGQMYSDFNTIKQELRDMAKQQETQWRVFNDKLAETIKMLNEEDDGVRGDFNVGDKHIQELEALRSERDKLELKVWYYEQNRK
jgi:hypothetical protein